VHGRGETHGDIVDVEVQVGDVQVAGDNDGLALLQLFAVLCEVCVPALEAVLQAVEAHARVWDIHIDEEEVLKLDRYGAALVERVGVSRDVVCDVDNLALGRCRRRRGRGRRRRPITRGFLWEKRRELPLALRTFCMSIAHKYSCPRVSLCARERGVKSECERMSDAR
jgi:hypothetical protein